MLPVIPLIETGRFVNHSYNFVRPVVLFQKLPPRPDLGTMTVPNLSLRFTEAEAATSGLFAHISFYGTNDSPTERFGLSHSETPYFVPDSFGLEKVDDFTVESDIQNNKIYKPGYVEVSGAQDRGPVAVLVAKGLDATAQAYGDVKAMQLHLQAE